jgi:glycolate oxidase FAD binding subunit
VEGAALSVAGLSGITLYEPGALTLVARAGTPLEEVEAALAAEGQRLAFEPMDHRGLLGSTGTPTLGGMVAANASGPRRVQVGACRDFLLGVRYVDGRGTVVKNGGRVMKNVTGYDLVKLMAGSWGTLGVLTELSLKVLPQPEAVASLLLEGLEEARAVAALSAALGSPFEVTGAAHVPKGLDGTPVTMLRIEGSEASVTYRAERLKALLADFAPAAIERRVSEGGRGTAEGWRWMRDVAAFHAREGVVWRASVKPSDGPRLTAALAQAGLAHEALYDWGGGLVWLLVAEEGDGGTAAIRGEVARLGGHATLVRGSARLRAAVPVFQPEAPALAALSRGLRARFDPRGILNPGLMG